MAAGVAFAGSPGVRDAPRVARAARVSVRAAPQGALSRARSRTPSRVPLGVAHPQLDPAGQRARTPGNGLLAGSRVHPRIEAEIDSARGAGRALDTCTRTRLESGLGEPLEHVRVHADARASTLASAVSARAFAVGGDLFFGAGEYRPGSREGDALIAHEAAHALQQRGAPASGPLAVSRPGDALEREAEGVAGALLGGRQTEQPVRGDGARTLARYAHQDCKQEDLEGHVWPADYIAKQMVRKAIRALEAEPVAPATQALFPKYFMTSSPSLATILHVFDQVDVEFRDNDYTYECEEHCPDTENGYTWSGVTGALTSSHIHLCMNNFQSRPNDCLARTIVHEFTHRYAGTDDNGYCKADCGLSSCPASLTAAKALENADSYACFAYELWKT